MECIRPHGFLLPFLKEQFQRQLDDPIIGRPACSAANLAEISAAETCVGITKLCVVEQVEEFPSQLDAEGFVRSHGIEGLMEPQVNVPVPRPSEYVFPRVAEGPDRRISKQRIIQPGDAGLAPLF